MDVTEVTLAIYAVQAVAAWIMVGVPIALAVPARAWTRIPWWLAVLIGAALGPVALLLLMLLFAVLRGSIASFSLYNTGSLWLAVMFISMIAFVSYVTMIRVACGRRAV